MSGPFALIGFSGPDAATFLQGQLTQDVRALEQAGALLAAWCNPKGRVICVARLLALDGGLALAVPAEMADDLVRGFIVYRLRARVEIARTDDYRALATGDAADLARLASAGLLPAAGGFAAARSGGIVALAPGGPQPFVELYGRSADLERAGALPARPLPSEDWQRALIDAGIPTILPATREKFTPHMLNLDRLGAVSFTKGCYTGQEVVARSEHLGTVKRRLARYRLESGGAAPGDRLRHGEREAGEVVNAAGDRLLAVVPVEWHTTTLTLDSRTAIPLPAP